MKATEADILAVQILGGNGLLRQGYGECRDEIEQIIADHMQPEREAAERDRALMDDIVAHWSNYKAFLIDKYPAKDGEAWAFSCEHHKRIDDTLIAYRKERG